MEFRAEGVIILVLTVVLLAFHLITEEIDRRRAEQDKRHNTADVMDDGHADEAEPSMAEAGSYARSSES